MDIVLNQKGRGVVRIYVVVDQRASTVVKLASALKKNDAMDYTIVTSSMTSEAAPLQYIAPHAGTVMAEYFMHQGKDVLIVYDDLSKHTMAYRAPSLLLERFPSHEAYPDGVFYLCSRLLERSSRPCDEKGGGSIAVLLIIETQTGSVLAYIPTNIIPITGGQTFLESGLFFSGVRPAVNVGLSMSRVGDAVQTKAMRKVLGSIRIDPMQYREMEIFTQFSSNPDEAIKEQLTYDKRLMELLKQPLGRSLSLREQVIILCTAIRKVMLSVEVSDIREFQMNTLAWFDEKHPETGKEVDETEVSNDDLVKYIVDAVNKCKTNQYKASV